GPFGIGDLPATRCIVRQFDGQCPDRSNPLDTEGTVPLSRNRALAGRSELAGYPGGGVTGDVTVRRTRPAVGGGGPSRRRETSPVPGTFPRRPGRSADRRRARRGPSNRTAGTGVEIRSVPVSRFPARGR